MSFFTIYTYGNYGILYNILTSMSAFFYGQGASGFMMGMVRLASILAILTVLLQWVGLTMYQKGNGFDLLFFVRFYLLYAFLVLVPTERTLIVDSTVGDGVTDLGAIPVNMKLPMGVIFINSVTSSIFHAFIVGYQKYFSMSSSPDSNYTRSGLAFGSAFISNLPGIQFIPVYLQQNLQNYITHCALPYYYRAGGIQSLLASKDLIDTLNIGNAGVNRWVEYQNNNGISGVSSCAKAYTDITGQLNSLKPMDQAQVATGSGGQANSLAPDFAKQAQKKELATIFLNAADTGVSEFSNASATGSELLKQAMTINMLHQGIRKEAAKYDATATANAAYDAMQFQQYQSGSQLSGEQAGRVVPALQNFAFTLLFMLYPVLVLMALLTSSFNAVIKYIKFSATIACIPFVYELLNTVIFMYAQGHNTELATNGLTMMNANAIYSLNANIVAAANYLSMATPAIAYMIISGSDMAITSVMGHSTQPAQSQASSVGQQQAHGDMRAGQFSMDTYAYNQVSANKFDDRMNMTTGSPIHKQQMGNTEMTNYGGGAHSIANTAQSSGPIQLNSKMSRSQVLGNAISQQAQKSEQAAQQVSKAFSHMINSGSGGSVGNGGSTSSGGANSTAGSQSHDNNTQTSDSNNKSFGPSALTAVSSLALAGAGAGAVAGGIGAIPGAVAGAAMGVVVEAYKYFVGQNNHVYAQSTTDGTKVVDVTQSVQDMKNSSQYATNKDYKDQVNQADQATQSFTESYSKVKTYQEQLNNSQGKEDSMTVNNLDDVRGTLRNFGYSNEEINQTMSNKEEMAKLFSQNSSLPELSNKWVNTGSTGDSIVGNVNSHIESTKGQLPDFNALKGQVISTNGGNIGNVQETISAMQKEEDAANAILKQHPNGTMTDKDVYDFTTHKVKMEMIAHGQDVNNYDLVTKNVDTRLENMKGSDKAQQIQAGAKQNQMPGF